MGQSPDGMNQVVLWAAVVVIAALLLERELFSFSSFVYVILISIYGKSWQLVLAPSVAVTPLFCSEFFPSIAT